jgi:hypothetical protein
VTENSENEDEDNYEEPDEATGTKKRRLKAPRGAAKMQKTDGDSAPKEKSQKRTKPRRKKAVAAKRG